MRVKSGRRSDRHAAVDLSTSVGGVDLPNPVLTASGTAGYGPELGAYLDLAGLGAVVTKSLCPEPWAGNPPPRLHPTPAGMLNSVGLQGPGVAAWVERELPALLATGARVVASIWGRSVEEYERAAAELAGTPITAVEVNLSCPNVEDRRRMFAHHPAAAAEVIEATRVAGAPRWAKLSPNVTDVTEIAGAVRQAGADAVVLTNTVMGMVIDVEARRPALGGGGGGLSGPAIHPVAVRAVFETRAAHPDLPIVGVGGVVTAVDALELLMAGAAAVEIGTALFADPAAPAKVLAGLADWCVEHHVTSLAELVGTAHRP